MQHGSDQAHPSARILAIAREILASEGLGALSFDAVARRLGRSKQAVLYWFPTRQDLLAALFLPWLEAEAAAAISAIAAAPGRKRAIRAFVTAVADFHLEDLDRFRLMYLAPQISGARREASSARREARPKDRLVGRVHPITGALYGALAERLGNGGKRSRAEALAIHSAVLGVVMMCALADSLDDPLRHSNARLVEALIERLT
jgi:AcrR family transcriptional regulator